MSAARASDTSLNLNGAWKEKTPPPESKWKTQNLNGCVLDFKDGLLSFTEFVLRQKILFMHCFIVVSMPLEFYVTDMSVHKDKDQLSRDETWIQMTEMNRICPCLPACQHANCWKREALSGTTLLYLCAYKCDGF